MFHYFVPMQAYLTCQAGSIKTGAGEEPWVEKWYFKNVKIVKIKSF